MRATIYSKNGTAKYEARDIEYHDSWMGEEYVTFTLTSPEPVNIEIGDYLVYRGLTYSANNVPSALKQARRNTYGAAFQYNNVKFSARSTELAEIRFHDYVLFDNEIHYTSLPKFQVYCDTVDDLLDRLQANVNRALQGNDWFFISPDYTKTTERYEDDQTKQAQAILLWHEYFGDDTSNPIAALGKEKRGVNIAIDDKNLWEGLGMVKDNFGLNFFCRDRVAVIGAGGIAADKVFHYGKGEGLATIERTADSSQAVVTRLYAYGSDKNLPLRYYSDVEYTPFMTVTTKQHDPRDYYEDPMVFAVELDLPWTVGMFMDAHVQYSTVGDPSTDIISAYANVEISFDKKALVPQPFQGYDFHCEYINYVPAEDDPRSAYNNMTVGRCLLYLPMEYFDDINVGSRIYFMDGVYKDNFNDQHRDYDTRYLPNNMAVDCLMLPGFPQYALADLCDYVIGQDEHGNTVTRYRIRKTDQGDRTVFLTVEGNHPIRFSGDRLRPYIESGNIDELGVKEADIHFTEEDDDNGLKEVYPSIEDMTAGDVFGTESTERLDELAGSDIIEDNGVFGEGASIPNFKVRLKDLGFNLPWAIANADGDPHISFKDGHCAGRTFAIKGAVQGIGGGWQLTLQRCADESLHLYFPYSVNASLNPPVEPTATEAFQLQAGDHFVLTGITLNSTSYVWAASVRALRKAILWLLNNDYTRFTYRPTVDEIFMARQDEAIKSGGIVPAEYGTVSLHDTLKAGMLMMFADTDLNIDGGLYIDSLTIKEGGNNGIPTYEVTLREDKQVGTMQRLQNQVSTISSTVNNGNGGQSTSQIQSIVKTYGREYFLSKIADDAAQGLIGFVKGLWVKARGLFGIDENGDAKLNNINANNIVAKGLTAQEAHFFNLIIDEVKSAGGQIVISPANAEIVHVVKNDNWRPRPGAAAIPAYILYFKAESEAGKAITNQFATNDLVLHMEFNVTQAQTRNYWYPVIAGTYSEGREPEEIDLDGDGEDETLCHYIVVRQAGKDGSGVPQAGDDIVCLGNTSNTSRQNAIVLSAYNIPFIDSDGFNDDEGIYAPLFVEYTGINGYNVGDGNRKNVIARNGTRLRGDFQVWNGSTSEYDSVTTLIQALANSITLRVSSIENTVSNGLRNLILNSNFQEWVGDMAVMFSIVDNTAAGDTSVEQITSNLPAGLSSGIMVTCQHGYDGIACGTWSTPPQPNFPIVAGKKYTFSWWVKTTGESSLYIEADVAHSGISTSTTWERKSLTFTAKSDNNENNRITILCMNADTMYLTGFQLEEGDKMTSWRPASEDMATKGSVAELQVTTGQISGRVSTLENNQSGFVVKGNTAGIYTTDGQGNIAMIGTYENGIIKLTANNIMLEGLVTANQKFKILNDGTIVAKDGVFEGEIKSESGTIGGFTIKDDHIGKDVGSGINGLFLYDWMIGFNAPNRQTILGTWNNSGLPILCRLTDTVADEDLPKYGLSIEVRGSLHDNVAIALNGGYVSGFGVKTQTVGLEYVTQNQQPTTPTTTTLNRSVNALYVTTQYYWRARTTDSYATKTIQRNIILPAVTNADDGHMIWIKRGVNDGSSVHIVPNTYTRREVDRIIQSVTYYKDVTYPTVFLIDHAEYLSSDLIINSEGDAMCLVFFPDVEVTINGVEYKGGWVQWKNPRNW